MKPLYVKKNGVVYKISGNGMPALYPAENVEYDNTVTSELQATDVQGAIDELSTRQGGVQSDWNENDTAELDYIKNKPQNLVQDANYVHTDNNYDATAKGKVDSLGTASTKDVGVANGVAELDAAGKVPSSQLPSFVDDVIEVADYDHLPITGESGKIYVTLDTNKTYRWSGSGYVEISASLTLGETSSTAYRGDRGKTAYDHATETKLSTATASGLYKVAATAQGHIASLTAVQKSDITALGIPGSDTDTKNTAYGTCDTAGDVKDKVATLVNATNWSLEVGTIVGVRFTYTNTYTPSSGNNVTLNVNNTGAKTIHYSDGIGTGTSDAKCPTAFGEAGQTIYYMYDGTYWVWVSHSKDNDTLYNFKGNEFRSADGNNYGQETGYGGNANYMVVNGHYYYNSNGPSTDIGASANDGAIYVQALDEDNVTQIAQNYENGNIFVRSKVNGSWTEWKKTIANITANNTVLTTDKTPFLTRQTLNPTGFSGYVREKLIGASYAWNQLVELTGLVDNQQWTSETITSNGDNKYTITFSGNEAGRVFLLASATAGKILKGHKYFISTKFTISNGTISGGTHIIRFDKNNQARYSVSTTNNFADIIFTPDNDYEFDRLTLYNGGTSSITSSTKITLQITLIDLTLAFGSTIADYLYGLSNNGGITKLRDMGCPIDKYTPYGYGLYSVKTSGKKIVGKNKNDNSNNVTGGYYESNGTWQASNDYATSGLIPVLPNTTYVGSMFDKNGNNRDSVVYTLWSDSTTCQGGYTTSTITTLSDTKFVRIRNYQRSASYITAKNFVFQLEIGSTNTAFEEYSCTTYPLGNDELRGKFDLVNGEIVASGDVKESNGEITRKWKEIDLGALAWVYDTTNLQFYSETISNIKANGWNYNVLCSKYAVDSGDSITSPYPHMRGVHGSGGTVRVYIVDPNYTDGSTLKNSLNGVYALCELATPTTEQSTPFADPMSLVGATTEEYIDTRDIPCPVGAERQYMGQSEDVIEIPSSPQSDGKRVLFAQTSGNETQYYFDTPTLYYKEYVVQGDGTKTYYDLLTELKPYYEALSEDEKTYSKVMMRANATGNECLAFVGNYWYSRMGVNASGLWIDQIDFQYIKYYRGTNGQAAEDLTNTSAGNYTIALRVLTYTRAES